MRRAEDIGGQELSYAEVKAIASGNPAVLTLAEADAELQSLNVLKKQHADEQYLARLNLRQLPTTIASLSQRLTDFTADRDTATGHAADPITIGNRAASYKDAQDVLGAALSSLPDYVREPKRLPLGVYRGLHFGLVLHPQFAPEVYLQGAATRQSMLSREHHGPRAILNALERLVGGYGSECDRVRQDVALAETQLRDYRARLDAPFTHDAYLSKLTGLRDQLKAGLSGAPAELSDEPLPAVSEIADQIKALKAGHTVEATPQRAGKRSFAAEEPVTARIRRRAGGEITSGPAVEP